MQSIIELKSLLNSPKNIVITMHPKPDGDAMGSSLGLYHYLLKKGHNTHVISPTEISRSFHWMPESSNVLVFTEQQKRAEKLTAEADIIFCLDFNALKRLEKFAPAVTASKAVKVMIDHHLEPEGFDDYRLWNANACATAELIYDFIGLMGDKELINQDIATCIYCGIMTDSGSFRFSSVTPHIHRIAAELMEKGINHSRIHEQVFDSHTESGLRMLGLCLKDRLKVLPEYHTAYICLSKEDLQAHHAVLGDTEGIVNYALSIQGIKLGVILIEHSAYVKLSFRSKGDFPANEIAKQHFNGGGHHNAAGGQYYSSIQEAEKQFLAVLPEYKHWLEH